MWIFRKPEVTHGGMRDIPSPTGWDGGRARLSSNWHWQRQTSTKLLFLCTKSCLRLQDVYWTFLSSFPSMHCSWVLVQNLENVNEYLSAADWYFANIFWKCVFNRRKLLGSCIVQNLVKQECRGWNLWQLSCSFSHLAQLTGVNWCYMSQPSLTRSITGRYRGQDFMNVQSVISGEDSGWWPLKGRLLLSLSMQQN